MAENKQSINLLPNKGDSFLTQFLNWSLNIGRLLIILTETAALTTFIYRFSLDMQIVDLHDKIRNQSFIVQNFKQSEEAFRNLQDRIGLAQKYDKIGGEVPKVFTDIAGIAKGKAVLSSLLVSNDIVKIEAQSNSPDALSNFTNELKQYPLIKSLKIDTINNSTTTALITVGMTAILKTSEKPSVGTIQGASQQTAPAGL